MGYLCSYAWPGSLVQKELRQFELEYGRWRFLAWQFPGLGRARVNANPRLLIQDLENGLQILGC